MAQYKVPQDVEAEDKLLGPFTFRQFIYLVVTVGALALCYTLFQVFPFLALIPLPIVVLFGALALPLKKDQPMETYLSAIVSFHLKPRKHIWMPGQAESTIEITAPKIVEKPRARTITEEEAGHRLSFLADLIDTEGQSIRSVDSTFRDEYVAEASAIPDFLDTGATNNLNQMINREENDRRQEAIDQLRAAMNRNRDLEQGNASTTSVHDRVIAPPSQNNNRPPAPALPGVQNQQTNQNNPQPNQRPNNLPNQLNQLTPQNAPNSPYGNKSQIPYQGQDQVHAAEKTSLASSFVIDNGPKKHLITDSPVVVRPDLPNDDKDKPSATKQAALENLARNQDYSIETLAKEAKRLEDKEDNEVYISLH